MEQPLHTLLAGWEAYYLIAGGVAGALIGLQFVVIALVADSRRRTTSPEIAAFGTPTVLHFSAALLLSALMSVPWGSLFGLHLSLVASGIAGLLYTVIVIRRARQPHQYRPEPEDWVWYVALPLAAYLTLAVAGFILARNPATALSLTAAVTLALVFIGVRNAWDTITFVATDSTER